MQSTLAHGRSGNWPPPPALGLARTSLLMLRASQNVVSVMSAMTTWPPGRPLATSCSLISVNRYYAAVHDHPVVWLLTRCSTGPPQA